MAQESTPEAYPVYQAVQKVRIAGRAEPVIVGLKSTGLDTYLPDQLVLHHDLEGRLLRMAWPGRQWRRGLSGRMIEVRRREAGSGADLERRLLSADEADRAVDAAAAPMRALAVELPEDDVQASARAERHATITQCVAAAARFDARAARDDVARFRAVYRDIPILPPDQYASLVLVASDGCRYNHCTFCDFYRDVPFRAKSPDEFRAHVQAAFTYHGGGLALRRGIFLGQANALLGPRAWREEILGIVNSICELPRPQDTAVAPTWWRGSLTRFTGMTSFLDAFVGANMTADEFAALRRLNLRQVFIGLETGADSLLKWLRKPASSGEMLQTVRAAKAGGVRVGVIVLVGAGGERFFDAHVRDTVQLIRAMQLQPGDYIYLSPLLIGCSAPYAERAAIDDVRPLTPARLAEQEQLLRRGLRSTTAPRGPYIARYEVEQFVY